MSTIDRWAGAFAQLASASTQPVPPRRPFNPHPPGVIREGSATEVVLAFLRKHRQHFFKRHQIVAATGRTEKAVDWALLFLRSQGLIEFVTDEGRNLRYLRYRARVEVTECACDGTDAVASTTDAAAAAEGVDHGC